MKTSLGLSALLLSACVVNSGPPPNNNAAAPAPPESANAPPASAAPAPAPAPAPAASTASTDAKPAFQDTDDPSEAPNQAKVAVADGHPKDFKAGVVDSLWIWHDAKGTHWHLRTSTKDKTHRFSGAIIGDADLKDVKSVKTEAPDRFKTKAKRASFDFYTTASSDGLDFDVQGNSCVRFVLMIDGKPAGKDTIHLGKDGSHPEKNNFKLCP